MARRARRIQADLRDARLRLVADDLVTLSEQSRPRSPTRPRCASARALVEAELANAQAAEAVLEAAALADAPALTAAQETWYELSQLRRADVAARSAGRRPGAQPRADPPRSGAAATPRTWSARLVPCARRSPSSNRDVETSGPR